MHMWDIQYMFPDDYQKLKSVPEIWGRYIFLDVQWGGSYDLWSCCHDFCFLNYVIIINFRIAIIKKRHLGRRWEIHDWSEEKAGKYIYFKIFISEMYALKPQNQTGQ